MVTLASSSQHCAGVVTCLCLLWEWAFHRGRREFTQQVVMNLHDPGFLKTSGFSTGFANDKYTSAVSNASVGLATI